MSINITHARGGLTHVEFEPGLTIAQALSKYLNCNEADVVGCLSERGEVARVGGVEVTADMANNVLGDNSVIALYTTAVAAGGVKGAA